MTKIEIEQSLTGSFAAACEEMNDFARSLWKDSRFVAVRTGADIRSFPSGWRLEKWVEAQLRRRTDLWAVWWLDFGPLDGGWTVDSHLAIDPDDFYLSLTARTISSSEAVSLSLSNALNCLKEASRDNGEFVSALTKHA